MNKSILPLIAGAFLLTGCSYRHFVSVENPSSLDRKGEIVEVALSDLGERPSDIVVLDKKGEQVPYQITYDDLLIFPVDVMAGGKARYKVAAGVPEKFDTLACGSLRLDRLDDIAWENDKLAYRMYGPRFEEAGNIGYGYDAFTKSVTYPIIEERYLLQKQKKSIHKDHGTGMDVYSVGMSLGCGADALMHEDALVYPHVYQTHKFLDNGPLRFTVKLQYPEATIGRDKKVVETRLLTLDAGNHLNKVSVSFEGLSKPTPLAAALVIHKENPNAYSYDASKGILSAVDLGGSAEGVHGKIFCGVLRPEGFSVTRYKSIRPDGTPNKDTAIGHILGVNDYTPGSTYTYWFGTGWDRPRPVEEKGNIGIADEAAWQQYLEDFSAKLQTPLIIKVK